MYFKMTKAKSNQYLQLVESYRNDEGKPRQRVIANLCNIAKCSETDISKLCHSFLRTLNVKDVVFFEDLQAEQTHDYGDVLPVIALWQQLHLDTIIQNSLSPHIKIDVPKATLLMVANKFADPQSKLGAWKWFDRSVFCFSREFQYFPTQDKSVLQNLYRSLDYLTASKDEIEKQLYRRLQCFGLKAELVLYDITSSYFEGNDAELAHHGYSRDHRPDRPQIVLGVVTSKEGIPFAHYVFEGNTADKSTVKDVLDDLKKRFGISYCIFVGDRGMVCRVNLDAVRGQEYDYIMGLRRHNSRLVRQLLTFIEKAPETSVLEIKPAQFNDETLKQEFNTDTRFIIGFNPAVQKQVRTHREQKLTDFENWRKELVTAGSLEEVTKSHQKVLTYLNQKKLKRFYSVSTSESDGQFKIEILQNDAVLAEEKLLDGHYFIQTEVKEQQLTDSEVVVAYKSLQKVERVFRVLKNNIELRPIYVRKEKRIRGHVFICFLTYLIECLMEKILAEHLPDYSLEQMKIELARVKLVPVTLNNRIDGKKQNLFFITGGNREVQTFYSALKIRNFRHPEKMYFEKKNDCSDNFFGQLSLIPLFSNTPLD